MRTASRLLAALGLTTLCIAGVAEARPESRVVPAPAPPARATPVPPELEALLGPAREPDAASVMDACHASRRDWNPGPRGPHRHRITAAPAATAFLIEVSPGEVSPGEVSPGEICLGQTPLTLRPPAGVRWRVEIRRAGHRTRRLLLPNRSTRQTVVMARLPPPPEPLFRRTDGDPFPHRKGD